MLSMKTVVSWISRPLAKIHRQSASLAEQSPASSVRCGLRRGISALAILAGLSGLLGQTFGLSATLFAAAPEGKNASAKETQAVLDPPEVLHMALTEAVISPVVAEYIDKGLEKAEQQDLDAVLLELDTPGGLLTSTHSITKSILNANVPVLVYVAPQGSRAASAGVFITMAGHIAAMAPATRIGAAHPVNSDGSWEEDSAPEQVEKKTVQEKEASYNERYSRNTLNDKVMNDTISSIENIARIRGRNVEWAKQAVTESVSITAEKAAELNVVDFVAGSVNDLLNQADGKTVTVGGREVTLSLKGATLEPYRFTWQQEFLSVLTSPLYAYSLLILGFAGLMFEITHPGAIVPGLAGALCIILALMGMQAMSLNMAGTGLLALGIILFGAELFTPTFGALFICGLVCLFLGIITIFQHTQDPYLQGFMLPAIGLTLPLVALAAFLIIRALRIIRTPAYQPDDRLLSATGRATMAFSERGEGKVMVAGEVWNARCNKPIEKDTRVRVIAREADSLWLRVVPVDPVIAEATAPPAKEAVSVEASSLTGESDSEPRSE